MNKEQAVDTVINILKSSENMEYIGEDVSQLEHALQCAYFAKKAKASDEVVLACLLHDIGHLCAPADSPQMDDLGVLDHEKMGADFLLSLGFSKTIAKLVAGHVQGKRYLCFSSQSYYKQLSKASLGTLNFQGGAMSAAEASEFQKDELFDSHLLVRRCDEVSKQVDLDVPGVESYRELLTSYNNLGK